MGEVTLNPFAYLVDTQGTALDDGLIYVGVANEDPVTNRSVLRRVQEGMIWEAKRENWLDEF